MHQHSRDTQTQLIRSEQLNRISLIALVGYFYYLKCVFGIYTVYEFFF